MKQFKTESRRLLDLMINSIYTNREIFLRELISNASDAEDKLYLASLTDKDIKLVKSDLAIKIAFDKKAGTITISDNGIGMNKDDLEQNLGTIAHSGSLQFVEDNQDKQREDIDIIGQFGVGFYSGFMVAQKIRVVSRAVNSDQAWAWESDGIEGYSISKASREHQGTDVILTLKKDTKEDKYSEFLNESELQRLVKKYSNYVRYPVRMEVTKSRELPKPDNAPDDYQAKFEKYQELDTLNSMIPIWKRDKKEVTKEDYAEFYKSDFHDFVAPLSTFTLHAEGTLSYDVLLFVPSHAPMDLYSKDFSKGLALYSSNVLIMDKCPDLISDHFNFIRGVVDSADLNLNISRETLQTNGQLRAIAKRIEKKLVSEFGKMRDKDRENYEGVFECFGRGLKYGIYTSYGSLKESLADLLLYYSAKQEKMVTLREYLDAAPSVQDAIYYAAGDDEQKLAKMPMVKSVLAKGYDVLLCVEEVDDFCMSVMADYDEKPLKNVSASDLGLETEAEKEQAENLTKDNEQLFTALKDALQDKVVKVIASTRLVDVPSGISAEGPISLEMEKVLANAPDNRNVKTERVLEINVNHPVFDKLTEVQDSGDTVKIALYANILYNQALLVEGIAIEDPIAFAQSVSELLV